MTVEDKIVKEVVKKVIRGEDYRVEIVDQIDQESLNFATDFLKEVAEAKSKDASADWYENKFLDACLSSSELAVNSGLNMKTIENMYGTGRREVVVAAAKEHYDKLQEMIKSSVNSEEDLSLSLKFGQVPVELTASEALMVINTLAVKRAALRGGAWSSIGKKAEKVLMKTLCKMYKVSPSNYEEKFERDRSKKVSREIDFYLVDNNQNKYLCEVKLMGHGNPESADAIFARRSNVFVADKLSAQNKHQAEELGVTWVELHEKDGYKRITKAFDKYGIPYEEYTGNLEDDLEKIIDSVTKG